MVKTSSVFGCTIGCMQLKVKGWCKNELFVIEGRVFEKND
jgi:hypothetical protein